MLRGHDLRVSDRAAEVIQQMSELGRNEVDWTDLSQNQLTVRGDTGDFDRWRTWLSAFASVTIVASVLEAVKQRDINIWSQ